MVMVLIGVLFKQDFFTTLAKSEDVSLWPQKIQQVNGADILRVARSYLNESNRILGHIAIGNENVSQEKKIDRLADKNSLERTLSDDHFRLAAYEPGNVKPYVVAQNTAFVQGMPVGNNKPIVNNDQVQPEASPLQSTTLRNGMRIVVLESHLSPLVQICGAIKAGSVYEQPDERGMSKLLAGLLEMGNSAVNKQQLSMAQVDLGMPPDAMLEFNSGAEDITFKTKCLNADFPSQMRQLFGCLMEPRLQNADYETAKTEVAASLRRAEKLTETRVDRSLLRGLIASNSPYYPIHPEEEISLMGNYKLKDLTDFYHEHISPPNTTIVVCGDVRCAEVFDLFEQLTQGWILNTQVYANAATTKTSRQPQLILSDKAAYKSSFIMPSSSPAEIVFGRIIPVPDIKQAQNYWAALSIADCVLSNHPILSHVGEQFNSKTELFDNAINNPWNTRIFKLENKLIWSLDMHLVPKSSSSTAVNAVQNLLSQFSKWGFKAG